MTNSGTTTRLALVGGGNMGSAIAGGLLAAGVDPTSLSITEVLPRRRAQLSELFAGVAVDEHIPPCDAAVIAVKPHDVPQAVAAAVTAGAKRIVSIAAGVTLHTLERAAGAPVAVIRAMPNTPALVGQGVTAIAAGAHCTSDDLAWASDVLQSVGVVVTVTETQLDAVTGLSGSGPAYVFLVAEALIDAGVRAGLSRPVADTLVRQLLTGSSALLATGEQPATLRANVTSPGGTTAAGLHVLEQRAVRAALADAVAAATARSVELGRSG
jgi:pyrroline-5-carboxylate reductase